MALKTAYDAITWWPRLNNPKWSCGWAVCIQMKFVELGLHAGIEFSIKL